MKRMTRAALLLVLPLVASCRTRLVGDRIERVAPTPRVLTGVPFHLSKPFFKIQRSAAAQDAKVPRYTLTVQHVADSRHRYTLNVDPALFSKYGLSLTFGEAGQLTGTTSTVTSEAASFVTAIGGFVADVIRSAADVAGVRDEVTVQAALIARLEETDQFLGEPDASGVRWRDPTPHESAEKVVLTARVRSYPDDATLLARLHYLTKVERTWLESAREIPRFAPARAQALLEQAAAAKGAKATTHLAVVLARRTVPTTLSDRLGLIDAFASLPNDADYRALAVEIGDPPRPLDRWRLAVLRSLRAAVVVDLRRLWAAHRAAIAESGTDAASDAAVLTAALADPLPRLDPASETHKAALRAFDALAAKADLPAAEASRAKAVLIGDWRSGDGPADTVLDLVLALSPQAWRYRHALHLRDRIEVLGRDALLAPPADRPALEKERERLRDEYLRTIDLPDAAEQMRMLRAVLSQPPKKFDEYELARVQLAALETRVEARLAELRPEESAVVAAAPTVPPAVPGLEPGEEDLDALVVYRTSRTASLEDCVKAAVVRERGGKPPRFVIVLEGVSNR